MVSPGDVLVNYSNAAGENGFLDFFIVASVSEDEILVSRPFKLGSSGSLLYNSRGEVAGMVKQVQMESDDESKSRYANFGKAISAKVIKEYLENILPKANPVPPPSAP
jgi:hypothetical protein